MLARDLLGAEVRDPDGRRGYVLDLRAVPHGESLEVAGIIVGGNRIRLFGYEREGQRKPVVLRRIISWLHRATRYVPIAEVEMEPGRPVRLRAPWDSYPTL